METGIDNKHNTYIAILIVIVSVGIAARLVPHMDNFVPITALSLLAAVYLPRKLALVTPLAMMITSDLFIGLHNTVLFTWGSFVLIALIGGLIYKKTNKQSTVVLFSPFAATLFFVVTNFGVWLAGGLYPHTWSGLVNCYTLALPFFRATLVSDIVYTPVVFIVAAAAVKVSSLAFSKYKIATTT